MGWSNFLFFFPNRTILVSMLRSDGGEGRKGVCSEWKQGGLMRDDKGSVHTQGSGSGKTWLHFGYFEDRAHSLCQ